MFYTHATVGNALTVVTLLFASAVNFALVVRTVPIAIMSVIHEIPLPALTVTIARIVIAAAIFSFVSVYVELNIAFSTAS